MYRFYLRMRLYAFIMSNQRSWIRFTINLKGLLAIANRYDEPSGMARVSGQCTLNVARDNTSACNETSFSTMLSAYPVLCNRGNNFLSLILILS